MLRSKLIVTIIFALSYCVFVSSVLPCVSAQGSIPNIVWKQKYSNGDAASAVYGTSDGGYVFLTSGWNHQFTNAWPELYKVNSTGGMEWSRTFEGMWAKGLISLRDGGYAILADWEDTYPNTAALIKTDAKGNVVWLRNFTDVGTPKAVVQSADGGFAILFLGWRYWQGHDQNWVSLVKTDSYGSRLWNRSYDNSANYTYLNSLIVTSDGGYAFLGTTSFNGTADTPNLYYWLVKTDSDGTLNWSQTYGDGPQTINSNITENAGALNHLNRGTAGDNEAQCFIQTSDDGFLIAGRMYLAAPYSSNLWKSLLVKTNALGQLIWNQTSDEYYTALLQTSDSGLVLAGSKIIKLNGAYTEEWTLTFPREPVSSGTCVISIMETKDGSLVILAYSGYEATWNRNYFLLKTEAFLPPPTPSPTPVGAKDTPLPTFAAVAVIVVFIVTTGLLVVYSIRMKNKKGKA